MTSCKEAVTPAIRRGGGTRGAARVRGDTQHAWVETWPGEFWEAERPSWVPEVLPARVVVESGEVRIEATLIPSHGDSLMQGR